MATAEELAADSLADALRSGDSEDLQGDAQ